MFACGLLRSCEIKPFPDLSQSQHKLNFYQYNDTCPLTDVSEPRL